MFGLNRRQLFILLLLVTGFYAATKYVPPYFYAIQFNDFIRQEVKYAVASRKTTEEIRSTIVRKAQELGINIGPRDVKITRRGPAINVQVEYRFPVDMRVYQHELVFNSNESGEIFEDAAR